MIWRNETQARTVRRAAMLSAFAAAAAAVVAIGANEWFASIGWFACAGWAWMAGRLA
jgi:hypothetical protein